MKKSALVLSALLLANQASAQTVDQQFSENIGSIINIDGLNNFLNGLNLDGGATATDGTGAANG